MLRTEGLGRFEFVGAGNWNGTEVTDLPSLNVIDPPGRTVNLNATNALGYSRYSPHGFNGRFLYARFAYNW